MEEVKKAVTLPLTKLPDKFRMVIPTFVEQKIRHLCNRVWEKEWSGTLFYKAEGSFEDKSLIITCVDIYVMDIGTATYTEFDMSPDVMTYMTQHPELMDCQTGLVHSHNTFSTFFSGTDTATLKEEGKDRNHFVSLIVNNAGTYTAAITRKVKSKRIVNETFSYESFEGVLVEGTDTWEEDVEEIQYFNLDITKEGNNYSFTDVDDRLAEIKKAKEVKVNTGMNSARYDKKFSRNTDDYIGDTYFSSFPKNVEAQPQLPFDMDKPTLLEPVEGVVEEKDIKADPKLIRSLCLQLLTGSVMISNESKIDIDKWVNNMKSTVEKRFGEGKEGIKHYHSFLESFTEFLVWDTEDPTLSNVVDSDYMASIIAMDMCNFLSTLPQNKYIEECQNVLLNYVS